MSCNLSDPQLKQGFVEICGDSNTNWLCAGYHGTRDTISVYAQGSRGFTELCEFVLSKKEVLYNIVKIDDSIVVVLTYIPPSTAGIQRARALVHHRAVGNLFKLTITQESDLNETFVRNKLHLTTSAIPPTKDDITKRVMESDIDESATELFDSISTSVMDTNHFRDSAEDISQDSDVASEPDAQNVPSHLDPMDDKNDISPLVLTTVPVAANSDAGNNDLPNPIRQVEEPTLGENTRDELFSDASDEVSIETVKPVNVDDNENTDEITVSDASDEASIDFEFVNVGDKQVNNEGNDEITVSDTSGEVSTETVNPVNVGDKQENNEGNGDVSNDMIEKVPTKAVMAPQKAVANEKPSAAKLANSTESHTKSKDTTTKKRLPPMEEDSLVILKEMPSESWKSSTKHTDYHSGIYISGYLTEEDPTSFAQPQLTRTLKFSVIAAVERIVDDTIPMPFSLKIYVRPDSELDFKELLVFFDDRETMKGFMENVQV